MEIKTPLTSTKDRYVPKGKGSLSVMGREGDTKYLWDRHNPTEVEAAQEVFDLLRSKGFTAYKVVISSGTSGEGPIQDFNPDEERYIFVPPMQGG